MSLIFWLVLSLRFSHMFCSWSALAISFVFRRVIYSLPKCVARLRSTLCFRDHGGGELIFCFSYVLRL